MKKTHLAGVPLGFVLSLVFSLSAVSSAEQNAPPTARPSLKDALASLKIPPDWFASTPVNYDTRQPWEKARLEVRRLLAQEPEYRRQAIKLTWLYAQKKDIGNGHELPMYLFMGGEFAWAIVEYQKFLATDGAKEDVHGRLCLAACYRHFGEYNKALEVLNDALHHLPGPPWRIAREADIADAGGDDLIRFLRRHHHNPMGALKVLHRFAYCFHKAISNRQVALDQMNRAVSDFQPAVRPPGIASPRRKSADQAEVPRRPDR